MLALRSLLVIAACRVAAAMPPAPVKAVYDQRQTGDLNVQIELKDLKIVALVNSELLDDYTDYDYFYDYNDFTVKPGSKPTASTTPADTGTTEKNDITQVSEPVPSQNSTISASADNTSPTASDTTLSKDEETVASNGTASSTPPNADSDDDKSQPSEGEDDESGTAVVVPSITVKPVHATRSQKRCRSGYVPNGSGRCRRAGRPWLSLLP